MRATRPAVLLIVLLLGFSTVFALHTSREQPIGIKRVLPEFVGQWYGRDAEVTQRERDILAADTQFARKRYTNGSGDNILASIVISGEDLDNSIHRPERCLPSQGLTIIESSARSIGMPDGQSLAVTRLKDVREVPAPGAKRVPIYNLNYYWFVGYHRTTASHFQRTLFDMSDRIIRGYNQRWAYVTVAADITQGIQRFGRSEAQTDALVWSFIEQLEPQIIGE
jgi:EpsI family protein